MSSFKNNFSNTIEDGSGEPRFSAYPHENVSPPTYKNPFRNTIPGHRASNLESDPHCHGLIPADENDGPGHASGQSHPADEEAPETARLDLKRRQTDASERSAYDYEHAIAHPTAQSDAVRTLHFYFAHAHMRFLIKDSDGHAVYYVDFSQFTSQPDVEVHAGDSLESPIVAVARFRWSRHLQLGLGDASDPNSMTWEEMRNASAIRHKQYRFEVTDDDGRRRGFFWKRTHNEQHGVEGILSKMSIENHKLVDEETGAVLAVYLENGVKSWKKKGKLQIQRGTWADENQTIVVLGICGLLEKIKRRIQRSANGGGG